MGHGDQGGFGDLLRRYRAASGMTQEELAERAGLSVRGISDLERGERTRPHRDTVAMLADALPLSPDDRGALLAAARMPGARDPWVASPAPVPTNLPVSPTPLIGRAEDVAAAARLLARAEVRLVNLTGPGGVGKTRLAIEVARNGAGDFPDGVFFVPLATFHDPGLVIPAIGRTLGMQDTGGQPLRERIAASVREKRLLLVLDNFEHLLAAAPLVSDLLAACAHLNVLVTSRAALHLSGEYEFAVSPLALPDRTRPPKSATLVRSPAIRLFVERAQATSADFAMTDINAAAVAEICVRLDGLPLAIELAAARVKLLPPLAMLARLRKPLHFLTDGARDLPTRQQTLRQTIAWSHDLLEPSEQALFRRLAVFVGGWTFEAAEAVNAGDDDAVDVLDALASLLDKNLIRAADGADDEARFTLLETIREFALERLAESGENAAIHLRHMHSFLHFAEHAASLLYGSEQAVWFARLEREHGNLRMALQWAMEQQEMETGARLAGALAWFWLTRGHLSEGRGWLEMALSGESSLTPATRARALLGIGMVAWAQADYVRAARWCDESLVLFHQIDDRHGVALALSYVARVALERGDYDRTTEASDEAVSCYEALGDAWGGHFSRAMRIRVAWAQGNYDGAAVLLEEEIRTIQPLGDQRGIGFLLAYLSGVSLDRGEHRRAETLARESLASFQAIGDKRGVGYALIFLAGAARDRGDFALAAARYRECLTLITDFGPRVEIAWALEGCALLHARHGEAAHAFRVIGAAAALRETIGAPLPPVWQAAMQRHLVPARTAIGERAEAAATEMGRILSLEEAIAQAVEAPHRGG